MKQIAKVVVVLCLALAAAQAWYIDDDYEDSSRVEPFDEPSERITGGVEVPPHSIPYQVGLFINMSQGIAFCGGSLLSEEWVLTAAHCAEPGWSFEIVLGAHYVKNASEATQVHVVTEDKTVHPDWSRLTLLNDVAVLRFPAPIVLTPEIQPIRLPQLSDFPDMYVGTEALMSGWGKQTDNATSIADTLQAINKTVIDHDTCARFYFGVLVIDAHICTSGSDGQSTCNGDSGGPLVYKEADGKPTQIGIVSFGIAFGCEVGWPPVFTRVTSYVKWILQTTGLPNRP